MGKTVLPTGDEYWRFTNSEYPKRAMIRITNLPILLGTDELEELLHLPVDTEYNGVPERETTRTDLGPIYTGRARIPIEIKSKDHEDALFKWSKWRNSEDGQMLWNEVPIYMSIPRLHKCTLCEAENRPQFIGHDAQWCRIIRRVQNTESVDEKEPQTSEVREEEVSNVVELQSQNAHQPSTEKPGNPCSNSSEPNEEDGEMTDTSSSEYETNDNQNIQKDDKEPWQQAGNNKRGKGRKSRRPHSFQNPKIYLKKI